MLLLVLGIWVVGTVIGYYRHKKWVIEEGLDEGETWTNAEMGQAIAWSIIMWIPILVWFAFNKLNEIGWFDNPSKH